LKANKLTMDKIKVALVDDHTMLRHGLATLVNNMPEYTVVAESDNGQDFIDTIAKNNIQPQVILLDVSMPIMDGFATAKWIQENLANAMVIVLSMMDDEKSIIKMIKHGARGYILKDGEPEELKIALHHVLHTGYHFNDQVNGKLVHAVNKTPEDEMVNVIALTLREEEFLQHCCSEMTYKQIGEVMNVSSRTVEGYRDQLFEKLKLKTRVGLVIYAIKTQVVTI
jgi:DNA-binding NarL/FixJ family response regulator